MANQLFKGWDNFNFLHLKFESIVSDELVNIGWLLDSVAFLYICLLLLAHTKSKLTLLYLFRTAFKTLTWLYSLSSFNPHRYTFLFSLRNKAEFHRRSASFIAFQGKNQNGLITKVIWETSSKSMQVMALWPPLPCSTGSTLSNDPEMY